MSKQAEPESAFLLYVMKQRAKETAHRLSSEEHFQCHQCAQRIQI